MALVPLNLVSKILLTGEDIALLQACAQDRRSLLEIGAYCGGSASFIRRVMHPRGHLVIVDPFCPLDIAVDGRVLQGSKEAVEQALAGINNGTYEIIQDYSWNLRPDFTTPLDFLFIDGNHRYDGVKLDWFDWSPLVVPGGVVVFHDAHPNTGEWGPIRLTEEIRKFQVKDWELICETGLSRAFQRRIS